MFEKVTMLAPMLHLAVKGQVKEWPTYDGKQLDRSKFVSSSEIGYCARRIWFSKQLPSPRGLNTWGYAERGHGHEAWMVDKLRTIDTEFQFRYMGDFQVSFYDRYQSGTPDGLWVSLEQKILFENKSIDPRKKVSGLPESAHRDQVIQNMDLVETCLNIKLDGGLIAYSDASNFELIREYYVDRSSPQVGERMEQLEIRAEKIMKATSADEVEPEGLYNGGCKTCDFGSQCSAAVTATNNERNRYGQISKVGANVFG